MWGAFQVVVRNSLDFLSVFLKLFHVKLGGLGAFEDDGKRLLLGAPRDCDDRITFGQAFRIEVMFATGIAEH